MTTTPITDRLWGELMDACKASGISPSQASKAFATLPQFRALEADVARLRALRELMGDVRDGSETAVTLSQDDATRDFSVRAGRQEYYGPGFSGVLDQIIQANTCRVATADENQSNQTESHE